MALGQWQPSKDVGEGQRATMLFEQDGLDLDAIARVTVVDATGRKWHGRLTRTDR